jgi:endonuclease/exonuclease/phosphatase (EEP) superfamily protein YafD
MGAWRSRRAPAVRPAGPAFRLLVGNVLWANRRLDDLLAVIAAEAATADVVALCEVTVEQAQRLDEVLSRPGVVEGRDDTEGVAVWSRLPITGRARWFGAHRGIDAVVDVGGRAVRLLLVHPDPPLPFAVGDWRRDLAAIALEAADAEPPVVVCGDLNGMVWPGPVSRLRTLGYRDVHGSLGRAWTRSWPAYRGLPRLARLDHAFVRGLVPVDVRDVVLPGSDHDGFVAELVVPGSPDGVGRRDQPGQSVTKR